MLKERPPQGALIDAKSLGNARKIPDGLNGELGHSQLSHVVQANLAIGDQPTALHTVLEFWKLHVSLGDGNSWAKIH